MNLIEVLQMARADADLRLREPQFGTPRGRIETAAHKWLMENAGHEGKPVMKSLAKLIRKLLNSKPGR